MHSAKLFLILGGVSALLATALGAFGAHGLSTRVPAELLAVFQTGVQYHYYHALGVLVVGLAAQNRAPSGWFVTAGWSMLVGTLLFCGSLYLLALTGSHWLGAVTPVGGFAFIVGWVAFVIGVWRSP